MKAIILLIDETSADPRHHRPYSGGAPATETVSDQTMQTNIAYHFGDPDPLIYAAIWLPGNWTEPQTMVQAGALLMQEAAARLQSSERRPVKKAPRK